MWGKFAAVSLAGVLLALPVGSFAAQPTVPKSLDDLVDVYQVGDVPADVLTVVDTSWSMGNQGDPRPWPYVQRGWADLVDAVRPQDRVGLITFDKAATNKLDLKPLMTAAERNTAKSQLPREPKGKATDIGAGIQAALASLSEPGAAEIQTLVFITDGKHNPGPNSLYPHRTGAEWEKLKKQGRELTKSRNGRLRVYGWEAGSDTTDIDLLQSVFPTTQIVDLPPRQIGPFLESAVLGLQRERVRPLVQEDLNTPIRAEFQQDGKVKPVYELSPDMHLDLVLRNDRHGLPTEVDAQSLKLVEADGTEVAVDFDPTTLTLGPGEQAALPVTIHPQGASHPPHIKVETDRREWQVDLTAQTSLPDSLAKLLTVEMLATPKQETGEVSAPEVLVAENIHGISVPKAIGLAALALLILLLLLLFLRWLLFKPPLTGVLLRRTGDKEWTQVKRLRGKTLEVPGRWLTGYEGSNAFLLKTKRRTRRGTVFAQRVSGQPRLSGAVMSNSPRRLAGQNEIDLGDGVILRYEKRPLGK